MDSFSDRLKQLRQSSGLTQQDLADEVGISASAIGMYEQGRREPDRSTLILLSRYFGVSIDFLLGAPWEKDVRLALEEMRKQMKTADSLLFNGERLDPSETDKLFDAMYVAASVMFTDRAKDKSDERRNNE